MNLPQPAGQGEFNAHASWWTPEKIGVDAMIVPPIRAAVLAVAASAALAGCASYDGYGRTSYGYSDYYPRASYYGWYDGYYYPGAGYYIYDRRGHRHSWNARHRRYWEARREYRRDRHENWSDYRRERRGDRRDWRRDRRDRDHDRRRDRR
jgi:hypothetical protein